MATSSPPRLQQATSIYSEDYPTEFGTADRKESDMIKDLTESAPAYLPGSEDASRSTDNRRRLSLWKRFTQSLRSTPTETTPIAPGCRRYNRVEQPINGQDEVNGQAEDDSTKLTRAYYFYKDAVVRFRNSAFILIVQLVFLIVPFSAVVMGAIFSDSCPNFPFLPILCSLVGVMGTFFVVSWICISCSGNHATPCSNRQRIFIAALGLIFATLALVDAISVWVVSASFDPTSKEDCNETFYTYAFYKVIVTIIAAVLSAIIYLPGSRHILCCQDPLPSNPFYYTI